MTRKLELVENGATYSNTGGRDVAFNRDLSLTPVWFNRVHGYRSARCSIQLQGAITAHSWWSRKEIAFSLSIDGVRTTIYKVVHTSRGDIAEVSADASGSQLQLWAQLHELHPWLHDFLAGKTEKMFIPYEGEPLALVRKREKWERFKQRFGVDLTRAIDRKVELEFLSGSKVDLDKVSETLIKGSSMHCDVHTHIAYYGSDGRGQATKLGLAPSRMGVGPSGPGSRGKPGVDGWRGWRYIIRVLISAGHTGRQRHNYTIVEVIDMAA